MRKMKIMLLAALAASGGTALWLWKQLSAEQAANIALRQQLAALVSRDQPGASLARSETPSSAHLAATPPAREFSDKVEPNVSLVSQQQDPTAQHRRLLKVPAYRKAMRVQQRQYFEDMYGELGKFLNLNRAQLAALLDLLTDQSFEMGDLQWQEPASNEERVELRRAREAQVRKADAQLEKMLGSSNLGRFKEFQQTLPSRQEVNGLRAELAMGSEALRDDQYQPMLEIVATEQERMARELQEAYAANPVAIDQYDPALRTGFVVAADQRIVESARGILTSAQLATIENVYRRRHLQMESLDALTKAQFEAEQRERSSDAN